MNFVSNPYMSKYELSTGVYWLDKVSYSWVSYAVFQYFDKGTLRKTCQTAAFPWPVFSCIRREYGKMRVKENCYSGIFYEV